MEIVWLYPDEIAAHPEGLPSNPIFAPYLSTDQKVLRLLTRLRGGPAS